MPHGPSRVEPAATQQIFDQLILHDAIAKAFNVMYWSQCIADIRIWHILGKRFLDGTKCKICFTHQYGSFSKKNYFLPAPFPYNKFAKLRRLASH